MRGFCRAESGTAFANALCRMTAAYALDWLREMLWTAVLTAGPTVLAVVAVGLLVAIVQAATQVNDQAVAFAPKAVSALVAIVISGPFILSQLREFTLALFEAMARVGQ